jgi:hypothetical protein
MFMVGPKGNQAPLCLDCNDKLQRIMSQQQDGLERQMNFLMDYMEMVTGIPTGGPRFPKRNIIQMQGPTFHNINIDRSTIGVLNTGSIQTVDSAVTVLKDSGAGELSSAILNLTKAILSSVEIQNEMKNDILEILSLLATEATVPKNRRRSKAMKPLISQLSNLVGIASGLSTIWDKVKPILEAVFQ